MRFDDCSGTITDQEVPPYVSEPVCLRPQFYFKAKAACSKNSLKSLTHYWTPSSDFEQ